jgi:hypothetical protein
MEQIRIGKNTFNAESLKGLTLSEAETLFNRVDPRIVKQAHEIANPKKATRKRKRKK